MGQALSHIALWRLCVETRDEPLTICEDDAVLRADFARTSATLLDSVPTFDIVLWGWNFDAVVEAEVSPGVSAAVLGDQAALRSGIDTFRSHDAHAAVLLRLRKALGVPCYTISPAGAATLLARGLPVGPVRLALPLMAYEIGNVTFDVTMASLYAQMSAHVALPPLAATRNDWSLSTVRLPEPLPAAEALAQADALQAEGRLDQAVALIQSAASADPSGRADLAGRARARAAARYGVAPMAAAYLALYRRLRPVIQPGPSPV